MINLNDEQLLSLAEAAKLIPGRDGGRLHAATAYRWASRGLRGVKLETVQAGGRLLTSVEALQRFFDRLSGVESTTQQQTAVRRNKAVERAERELERARV